MTKRLDTEDILTLARILRLALVLVDGSGQVLATSPRALQILGLDGQSVLDRPISDWSDEAGSFDRFLQNCRRTSSLVPGSIPITREGETRRVRCEGTRMPDSAGDGTRILLLLRSEPAEGFSILNEKLQMLSQEVQLRQQIEGEYRKLLKREQKARRSAEETDRMKDEFLAIVSHELRTPLNAMMSWTQILQMEDGDGRMADGLARIERNAKAQARLIDDLLDTSRIVSNQVGIEARETVVGEMLREVIETARPQASKKQIDLDVAGDLEATAELDPARIKQVLGNLVENAIKFSESGTLVRVSVAADETKVFFRVQDHGRGLREDEVGFVFDRFRQVDSHSRRKHGGLGLGLAIARQLVELHGGTIHAESGGLGQGAVFAFELPRRSVAPVKVQPSQGTRSGISSVESLRDQRVLVVEDNDDAREALVRFLERVGADVIGVSCVPAALIELDEQRPTVILTDLQMPGEDGHDLLRKVRRSKRFADIPVLALTAHARPKDKERALEAGFDAYLAKPVPSEVLLGKLSELCARPASR